MRFLICALVVTISGCSSAVLGSDPYGAKAVNYLDVSLDGKYVGGVRQDGEALIVDLASRKRIEKLMRGKFPGLPGGPQVQFLAFRGERSEVLWDCRPGSVCVTDLRTGEREYLFEHDPQDNVMVGVVSRDGNKMAFGTRGGRVFSYDAGTGGQRTMKPRDIWTRVVWPMYTLEAPQNIERFLTASAQIGAAALYETSATTKVNQEEGYLDKRHHDGSYVRDVLYRGINIWDWESGQRFMIDDDFSDKIRADWSRDGRLVAINQEGGSPYAVYRVSESGVQMVTNLFTADAHHCSGLRFLDSAGRYLGVVSYDSKIMTVIDRETVDESQYDQAVKLELRTKPAGGRRMMVAYPEKGWVFLGLRNGGIDWYEFRSGPKLSLRHVATLR